MLCAAAHNTYIPTWEGWLYLATVIDCHTKAVVGYATDDNYQTPLVEEAIRMAARNYTLESGAVFHSDRGSNYTSAQFADTLCALDIRPESASSWATRPVDDDRCPSDLR